MRMNIINEKSFIGNHDDDIIANISWELRKPLDKAYLFIDKDYENENLAIFGPHIYKILNSLYIKPKTTKFVINLWSCDNDPLDIKFDIFNENNKSVTHLDILNTIDNFLRNGERKYGEYFISRNVFIKGIYNRPYKYSKIDGPYFELDYFDV